MGEGKGESSPIEGEGHDASMRAILSVLHPIILPFLRGKRGDTSKHSWKTLPLEVERT
jgi:hypothetical protein